jgi:hypothetical protein
VTLQTLQLPHSYDLSAMRGSVTPRLWTPPLRPLTPETSRGFAQVTFAREVLRRPLDPWQEWLVIHAGEMLPDGRPRYRHVLVLVSRQNGKTYLLVVLSLFWMFVDRWPLVFGTSTKLDYARESWDKATKIVKATKVLRVQMPARGGFRRTNGEQEMTSAIVLPNGDQGTRYKIGAASDDGGRSLAIDRLVQDELRQHKTYDAWNAGTGAMSARPYGQNWALSNAGVDGSVVLNDRRDSALRFIKWWETNGSDEVADRLLAGELPAGMPSYREGMFEWSADTDADPLDPLALAQANPNLNVTGWDGVLRMDPQELYLEAASAVESGGLQLAGFKTERMCIRVPVLDAAVDAGAWKRSAGVIDLAGHRVALCVDVSPDLEHATLTAAAPVGDDLVMLDVVDAWSGPTAVRQMLAALPGLVLEVRPVSLGWFPSGPAAAALSTLRDRAAKDRHFVWPPPWLEIVEITSETSGVCMGFAVDVRANLIRHGDDPLQNDHVTGADKLPTGDTWRFSRRGAGHVDAAYSAAGAAHLARIMPAPAGPLRLVGADD